MSFRPSRKHFDELLRAHAAGNAFAAGFVAVEADCVQRHIEHAAAFGADNNRARADHRTGSCYFVPIERKGYHGCGQVSRRRAGWRVGEQLAISKNAARVFVDELRISRAHGDFKNSWTIYIAADPYKLHAGCGVRPLRFEPLRSPR